MKTRAAQVDAVVGMIGVGGLAQYKAINPCPTACPDHAAHVEVQFVHDFNVLFDDGVHEAKGKCSVAGVVGWPWRMG